MHDAFMPRIGVAIIGTGRIALAIHLVVHLARINGRRTVTEIVTVRGYDPRDDRFLVAPLERDRCGVHGGVAP